MSGNNCFGKDAENEASKNNIHRPIFISINDGFDGPAVRQLINYKIRDDM